MASSENIKKVVDYLDSAKIFYLATVDGDQPKCRPLGFKMVYEDKIYFGVGTFKNCFKQMQTNPKVEICASTGQDFLRYYGTIVVDDRPELFEQACAEAEFLKSIYNDETGYKLGMFYLRDATAEIRSLFDVKESLNMD